MKSFTETLKEGTSFDMIWVEGGSFLMGNREEDAESYELPVHEVHDLRFLYWEVSGDPGPIPGNYGRESFQTLRGMTIQSSRYPGMLPTRFIKKLNQQTRKTYRLLTEAEWEYAARGGVYSEDYLYSGSDNLKEVGWFKGNNTPYGTKPVRLKLPNELGIYDMSGNVWEWCEDDYRENYEDAPKDGSAWIDQPNRGGFRVLRGGDWLDDARNCRVSFRNWARARQSLQQCGVSFGSLPSLGEVSGLSHELKPAPKGAGRASGTQPRQAPKGAGVEATGWK